MMIDDEINAILKKKNYKSGDIELYSGRSVYVYGAGSVGREIGSILKERGVRVEAFIDRNASKFSSSSDFDVIDFPEFARRKVDKTDAVCVIGLFNPFVDCNAILEEISKHFHHVVSFHDFFCNSHARMGDRFWLTLPDYYDDHVSQIRQVVEMLGDALSKDVLMRNLEFRITGRYDALASPSPLTQYFPSDIPTWGKPLRIVDCGAFDGDTVRTLSSLGLNVEAYAGFEPDLANFQKLTNESKRLLASHSCISECVLFPCGVSAKTELLRFESGMGASSQLTQQGDTSIQCVALDDVLPNFRPNLIKMDIEGAELDALRGANEIITRDKPGLAICVYHKPDDMWTIPLFLNELLEGHGKYFLRSHCYNGFDLVLYWLPDC
jgi:FkbM family methyltransferase